MGTGTVNLQQLQEVIRWRIASAIGAPGRPRNYQELANRLAEISGETWSKKRVGNYVRGDTRVTADALYVIAEAQNMPIDWYFRQPPESPQGVEVTVEYPMLPDAVIHSIEQEPLDLPAAA